MAPEAGHNSEVSIDYKDLSAILDELRGTARTITEASGKHRQKIKEYLEDQEWHAGAFAQIRKIADMSETARADYLRTFRPLFKIMLDEVWESELADMVDAMESEGDEE